MSSKERLDALEFALCQIRNSLNNLEMSISPLTFEHVERICWISGLLQPRKIPSTLKRFGSQGDGGYVLAPPSINGITLSIGVGYEISTDLDLITNFGHKVYAFDPFVNQPPDTSEGFIFHKIGLAAKSKNLPANLEFEDIHSILKRIPGTPDLALIDIEGSEWDLADSFEDLREIKQIAIEFHGLDKVVDDYEFSRFKAMLLEITNSHFPIHVHANNDGPTIRISGAVWPSILEVTFIRKDLFNSSSPSFNFGPWPGDLDYPNSPNRPDLDLQPFFGVNAVYRTVLDS